MARDALKRSEVRASFSEHEIVDIAIGNIGIGWTIDGCTDFVWGVTNLAGVPFFDLQNKTIGNDPTLPQDTFYVAPHSLDVKPSTDNQSGDG